ncbi:carboxylesterase 1E-like isoform X2 [Mya arenaria]|uniref:carboxylesterase 1E-like isoform X2 n=1 Tax=Mya arenaria TaxID=6604 RepID=UPI0022E1C147|nr:carboxylesterase 1E-like isoform X2 [Mya arenaria]
MQSLRYMNGVNGNEGLSTFLEILNAPLNDMIVTKEMMDNDYIPKYLPYMYPAQEVPHDVQKVIAHEYTNWVDPEDATRMFVKYAGDVTYNVDSMHLRTLRADGEGSRTWVYSFEANIDQHLLQTADWATTANHGDELAPLFGYQIDYKKAFNMDDYQPPAWELDLSERMMTFWTNFAKHGNPSGNDSITWPEYEQDSMRHLVLDRTDSIGTRQFAREVAFWRELVPDMMAANEACTKDKGPGDMIASSANSAVKYFGLYITISFATLLLM